MTMRRVARAENWYRIEKDVNTGGLTTVKTKAEWVGVFRKRLRTASGTETGNGEGNSEAKFDLPYSPGMMNTGKRN